MIGIISFAVSGATFFTVSKAFQRDVRYDEKVAREALVVLLALVRSFGMITLVVLVVVAA